MKFILLVFLLISTAVSYSQEYFQYNLGYAFKKKGAQSVLMDIHAGYQLNNILLTQGVASLEYNQRVLVGGGINPAYLGGRIGYGYNINEDITVAIWGAEYYRILASGIKSLNYWIPGYGLSARWKIIILDVSNVDVYHVSLGCRYLFE